MSRPKKDIAIRRAMCQRFVIAMERLEMNASELARALGYANATTILKVQRGESFVDVERLHLLANLRQPDGKTVDLNWLIVGDKGGEK